MKPDAVDGIVAAGFNHAREQVVRLIGFVGDESRQEMGASVLEDLRACFIPSILIGQWSVEIDSRKPVDLDVDQSRRDPGQGGAVIGDWRKCGDHIPGNINLNRVAGQVVSGAKR